MKRALVFSGGGAKGSYELGVWRALKHLHKRIDIVTGTSIGSANGALFVQNEYSKAYKLWTNTTTKDLLSYDTNEKFYSKNNKNAIKEIVKNVGLPSYKGEEVLRHYIDEDKIRKSKIDFGIVTVSTNKMMPKELTKDIIPQGKMIDYIVASCSAFPAISRKKIDGDFYIDGGYYDNMPINLAIKMGADEVIAVDLSSVGNKVKINDKNVKVDIIKTRDKDNFTLEFTREKAMERMILGYNDTMKHFGKLSGNIYTFKKYDLDKNYKRIGNYYEDILKEILLVGKNKILKEIINISKYKKLVLDLSNNKKIEKTMLDTIEYLGEIFNIRKDKIYDINTFNKMIIKEAKTLNYITVSKNLKGKMLIGYMYNKYLNEEKDKAYKELFNIALVFQKDFLAACYLIALTKKYPINIKLNEFHDEIYNILKGE